MVGQSDDLIFGDNDMKRILSFHVTVAKGEGKI